MKDQTRICKQNRCVACGLQLERPVVYFRCGHCFHKACVDLSKAICPKCEGTGDMNGKEEKVSGEALIRGLKEAQDGFAYAADCFEKDMFTEESEPEPEPEPELAPTEQLLDDDDNYVAEDITQSIHLMCYVCYNQTKDGNNYE